MDLWAGLAYGFALVLLRTLGLVIAAPLLSLPGAPQELRLGLSGAIALAAFTGAGSPHAALPAHLGVLLADVAVETVLGLLSGLVLRFGLESAAAAGQLAAQAVGLGDGAVLDPLHGAESTALGELLRVLALSAAIALGLHREAILWLASSVAATPPGTVTGVAMLARGVVLQAIDTIGFGVRLGLPFLAAVTLGHLVLGLLGRAAQQLQLSNVGFSVSILFGGAALWVATPAVLQQCAQATLALLPAR
ncbi:MAG: flagellar biosynthetic protein FliR [Myxococcaceae bacterium]|nr:flagellar biosynthetic protein FliR [Myxococcaceae bacterium]